MASLGASIQGGAVQCARCGRAAYYRAMSSPRQRLTAGDGMAQFIRVT